MPKIPVLAVLVASAFTAGQALAAPILSPYPAPGGNTASATGNPAMGAGKTWTLGGFNPSAYSNLYYGVGNYLPSGFDPTGPTLTMDGSTDTLSFNSGLSNLATGTAVWTGTTNFLTYNYGNSLINTRFTLKVSDLSNNALALTSASSLGLAPSLGAVLDVQGAFKANWLFEADGPSGTDGFRGSLDMFNDGQYLTDPGYIHASSVGGAFYYTAPVPEPETYAMMLAGLGLLGLMTRRRKQKLNALYTGHCKQRRGLRLPFLILERTTYIGEISMAVGSLLLP